MPELPDVEVYRRIAQKSVRKPIREVSIKEPAIVSFSKRTANKYVKAKKIHKTSRHGKFMFLHLAKKTLALHFGMTGDISYRKGNPPEYCAMQLKFAGSYSLSIITKRKLGKIELTDDAKNLTKPLGSDALRIRQKNFYKIMQASSKGIKSALMDQEAISGIGNIYSDEILFHSKIHPKKKAKKLDDAQIKKLHKSMREVLTTAIKAGADPNKMPKNYLINHRGQGEKVQGHKIKKIKINSRSTYFAPDIQK